MEEIPSPKQSKRAATEPTDVSDSDGHPDDDQGQEEEEEEGQEEEEESTSQHVSRKSSKPKPRPKSKAKPIILGRRLPPNSRAKKAGQKPAPPNGALKPGRPNNVNKAKPTASKKANARTAFSDDEEQGQSAKMVQFTKKGKPSHDDQSRSAKNLRSTKKGDASDDDQAQSVKKARATKKGTASDDDSAKRVQSAKKRKATTDPDDDQGQNGKKAYAKPNNSKKAKANTAKGESDEDSSSSDSGISTPSAEDFPRASETAPRSTFGPRRSATPTQAAQEVSPRFHPPIRRPLMNVPENPPPASALASPRIASPRIAVPVPDRRGELGYQRLSAPQLPGAPRGESLPHIVATFTESLPQSFPASFKDHVWPAILNVGRNHKLDRQDRFVSR